MTAIPQGNDSASEQILHIALELSDKKWKLGFDVGGNNRQTHIEAGDWLGLNEQIQRAKDKLKLPP